MPPSRKRIRKVNGLLMMFTTPLIAYAFAIASPQRPRLFVMVWTIVAGLVLLVLLLALGDIINTWFMSFSARRELRRQLAAARAQLASLNPVHSPTSPPIPVSSSPSNSQDPSPPPPRR